jgi:uncharacterized protein YecT (DUF1311 family)
MINRTGVLVILLLALANQGIAEEILYSEKVLLTGTHDPRHITFIYEDGEKLSGVHVGVELSVLWDLDSTQGSQWFNAIYSKDDGLILKHLTKKIEFRLVGQVTNHPIDRILKACYKKVGGSSMGIQRCLDEHDKLIDVEINRTYQLLEDNGEDIKDLQEAWQKYSQQQYAFIRQFYSKHSGTKWLYKSMGDVVDVSGNHLHVLNELAEDLFIDDSQ